MLKVKESSVAENLLKMKVISTEVKVKVKVDCVNHEELERDGTKRAMAFEEERRRKLRTRRLVLRTLCNGLTIVILGMLLSMKGPSFIDLQLIADTDVEGGSAFFTAYAFGYMMGSLLAGSIYKRVQNKALLMIIPMVLAGLSCGATPFCDNYFMMVMVHVLEAGFASVFDTTANTEEVHRWEGKSDSAMQFLSFCYSLGGVVGPLLVQPFLAPENNTSSAVTVSSTAASITQELPQLSTHGEINGTSPQHLPLPATNATSSVPYSVLKRNGTALASTVPSNYAPKSPSGLLTGGRPAIIHLTNGLAPTSLYTNFSHGADASSSSLDAVRVLQNDDDASFVADEYKSRIYIPYMIVGAISILAAIPFCFIYLRTRRKAAAAKKNPEKPGNQQRQKLPTRVYVMLIGLLGVFYFFYTAVDDPFSMFLPVFVVSHLSWSKESGALLSAVYWICGTVTKLAMILLIRHVNNSLVMFASTLGMVLSTMLFTASCSLYIHELVWVSTAMLAVSQSSIFGGTYAWADAHLLRLDGRVTSFTIFFAALGGMVEPMVIGVSMKELSPMAFPYLMVGQSFVLFLLFLTMLLVARPYVLRRFGPIRSSTDVTLVDGNILVSRDGEEDERDGGGELGKENSLESVALRTGDERESHNPNLTRMESEEDEIEDKLLNGVNGQILELNQDSCQSSIR
ncbi:sodium-dependent glucose transporter 1 [Elysia marginata]|uniref:Sodium-dependent glucose transporter 1 n=1 Tax=Elysia marginata TaxID=1093978 RepID=A0AAV4J403_9GAST|nr:sodium-dependent glucose transporter 1 [Elysia marginata]